MARKNATLGVEFFSREILFSILPSAFLFLRQPKRFGARLRQDQGKKRLFDGLKRRRMDASSGTRPYLLEEIKKRFYFLTREK